MSVWGQYIAKNYKVETIALTSTKNK